MVRYFGEIKRIFCNPLWMIAVLAAVIVACGGDDPTATSAPAAATEPTATTAAAAPAATERPATATPAPTISAPGARPQVEATPTPIPTAVPMPTEPPAPAATAKITRVRVSNTVPLNESNRIWVGPWSNLVQHDPYGETLIENDPYTSEPVPALAESWEVTPDFKTWTFQLREGVPWHFGYGEFTSADVVHTWELLTRGGADAEGESPSNSNFKAIWLDFPPTAIDAHTVAFTHEKFFVDGGRLFSRLQGDLVIQSKAQWDAAGGAISAYDEMPAGTGSYQYGGRKLGETQWFVRAEGEHWGGENPDFDELEWVWAPEDFTRLAQLLAGEVQGADISRDLQAQAKDEGMKVLSSNNENNQSYGFFGGTYLATVDSNLEPWPDGEHPFWGGDIPWHDPVVREAFNRAVDREAIIDAVYFGNASPMYVPTYAPFTEGWNDDWVTDFEDYYGYDPERARELLAEAGYEEGEIQVDMISTVIPGNPEIPQLIEALSLMWEAIGVDTTIVELEFGQWLDRVTSHDIYETFTILRNTPIRTTQEGLRVFWTSAPDGFLYGWESDFINERYNCLESELAADRREQCAREAGDYMFEEYTSVPLFQVTFDITVDPEFIESWVYPGVGSAHPTHVHLIKACPVGTDICE